VNKKKIQYISTGLTLFSGIKSGVLRVFGLKDKKRTKYNQTLRPLIPL
jgi:hypothetical protein